MGPQRAEAARVPGQEVGIRELEWDLDSFQ